MASEEGSDSAQAASAEIPSTHPVLARLAADGVDFSEVVGLRGLVGIAPGEGLFRLHPRLDDLTISVDIATGDVLHVAAGELPDDIVVAWVWRNADVTFRRTRVVHTSAEDAGRFFGPTPDGGVTPGRGRTEMRSGRLNIRMNARALPQELMAACGVCTSRCATCMSQCGGHQENHEVVQTTL
jgi:hypothetical protein